ncbi:hypothetical protein B4589_010900 [Halolamina sp. CBA1230]|uniref:DUF7289 family protein n=1 Tax=Halolamina sp. CBA1230 TaxID=1853690 RepID=UPI0009A197A5|nr:hypothetical protein [Halolamina sp. CBA1230]QKY20859.1 hypothetical protein B4589_010900 [Halolamina sp. CBA1230]
MSDGDSTPRRRAQSHVVGVALLIAITTISMGALTAGVGGIVESNAAAADADRVADSFADIDSSASTGVERHDLAFGEGSLSVEPRTVRLFDGDRRVAEREAKALVFEAGDRRATYLAGGVVRGVGNASRLGEAPPIATGDGLLLVGLPVLNVDGSASIAGESVTATLRTDTSHERRELGRGEYRLAVETATPGAWERYFAESNASVTRRAFDGDEHGSVVATFPAERTGYLVVHEVELEVET